MNFRLSLICALALATIAFAEWHPPYEHTMCSMDMDCADMCTCDGEVGVCFHKDYLTELAKCQCSSDSDCGDDTCNMTAKLCSKCMNDTLEAEVAGCGKDGGDHDAHEGHEEHEEEKPCVATAWLKEQGLERFVIQNGGQASVLCIPGLPCGTHGHMLRSCNAGTCSLVTYRKACAGRDDCVSSKAAVSQLSHTLDWSKFSADTCADSGSLELTSLSAHPDSCVYSASRILAHAADLVNKAGLGAVCDSIVKISKSASGIMKLAPISSSK